MPVRKVHHGNRNIIGNFASIKMKRLVEFESTIERDYLYMLDYQPSVISFEEQPFTIDYTYEGKTARYTPDFLVSTTETSVLVDCKPTKSTDQVDNQRKFQAARDWCEKNCLRFEVVTDDHLRIGHELRNVKLLTQFARHAVNATSKASVRDHLMQNQGTLPIASLTELVSPSSPNSVLVVLFHMAFHHTIDIEMTVRPISHGSLVSLHQKENIS